MDNENKYVSLRKIQEVDKPTIQTIARQKLEGEHLKGFEGFLNFLKEEKISLPWKSINGFNANYKGKRVGAISLGSGVNLGDDSMAKKFVLIGIATAEWDKFDVYLEGQTDEIVSLFMERINNKCKHCRPTCGCSRASGNNFILSNRQYENICFNAPGFGFLSSSGDMRTMTLLSPCAVYPPIPVRSVPIETVKKLIIARKEYISKM